MISHFNQVLQNQGSSFNPQNKLDYQRDLQLLESMEKELNSILDKVDHRNFQEVYKIYNNILNNAELADQRLKANDPLKKYWYRKVLQFQMKERELRNKFNKYGAKGLEEQNQPGKKQNSNSPQQQYYGNAQGSQSQVPTQRNINSNNDQNNRNNTQFYQQQQQQPQIQQMGNYQQPPYNFMTNNLPNPILNQLQQNQQHYINVIEPSQAIRSSLEKIQPVMMPASSGSMQNLQQLLSPLNNAMQYQQSQQSLIQNGGMGQLITSESDQNVETIQKSFINQTKSFLQMLTNMMQEVITTTRQNQNPSVIYQNGIPQLEFPFDLLNQQRQSRQQFMQPSPKFNSLGDNHKGGGYDLSHYAKGLGNSHIDTHGGQEHTGSMLHPHNYNNQNQNSNRGLSKGIELISKQHQEMVEKFVEEIGKLHEKKALIEQKVSQDHQQKEHNNNLEEYKNGTQKEYDILVQELQNKEHELI